MPARWRRVTSRSVRVVSYAEPGSDDLLSMVGLRPVVASTRWRPATDVCETATSIELAVELAGVSEDDLDIELYPDAVILDGVRTVPVVCGTEAVYHALQIRRGPFHVEVALPRSIDVDRADATLEAGLLRISLTKAGIPSPKRESEPKTPADGPGPAER